MFVQLHCFMCDDDDEFIMPCAAWIGFGIFPSDLPDERHGKSRFQVHSNMTIPNLNNEREAPDPFLQLSIDLIKPVEILPAKAFGKLNLICRINLFSSRASLASFRSYKAIRMPQSRARKEKLEQFTQ
jgi:hypothetical protein